MRYSIEPRDNKTPREIADKVTSVSKKKSRK